MIKEFPNLEPESLRSLLQEKIQAAIDGNLPESAWEKWQDQKSQLQNKSRKKPAEGKSRDYFTESLKWFQTHAPDSVEGIDTTLFARVLEALKTDEITAAVIHGDTTSTAPADSDLILALRLSHGMKDPADLSTTLQTGKPDETADDSISVGIPGPGAP